jgi:hypothetical protein
LPYGFPARGLIEREELTGENMKSRRSAFRLIALLAALIVSVRVTAQDVHVQPHQYHHYQLNDVGTFGGLIKPMFSSAGSYPLALCTYTDKRHRTIDADALEIPRPERAESTRTEKAASPFQAEPAQIS